MVLHYPARRAAGPAGVDQASGILARDFGDTCGYRGACSLGVAGYKIGPVVIIEAARLLAVEILDPDHVISDPGPRNRTDHRAQQLLG